MEASLLTGTALARAADDNLATHAGWVQARTAGMHVVAEQGLVLIDSGLPCDTFNFVCRARLESDTARRRIAEAIAYFRERQRPFSWWLGPADEPAELGQLLVEAGLEQAETEVAMAADLAALAEPLQVPADFAIRQVATAAELAVFARLSAANWTPPDPHVLRFYELAAPLLLTAEAPLRLYLGYLADVPVATAELTLGGGVVGLYNISTVASVRRRGIGSAMTLEPLLAARREGFRTAVLQAAAEGVGIYRRVGFVPFGGITEYKPATSS